ncbi:MAG: BMC domain-containing protein [Tissierellia bacterium]|nr:BMC domain-containing protein [Tissierellia bacterium]
MSKALGLIEALGLATAVTALDAASKAADVTLVGFERIIGVGKAVGVNIQIAGEVAAVKAAVDAGVEAGNRVGVIFSSHVIPRPHDEVNALIAKFGKNLNTKKKDKTPSKNKKAEGNSKKEEK